MRVLIAVLMLWAGTAQAWTFELTLTGQSFEMIDRIPDDGIAPSFTVTSEQGIADLMTPVHYHAASENEPSPPPSSGNLSVIVHGYLAPGSELRWSLIATMTLSVIDVDNGFDYDYITADFGTFAATRYPGDMSFGPAGLTGMGATYQRIYEVYGPGRFGFDVFDEDEQPEPFFVSFGYSSYFDGWTNLVSTPIPEPGTHALLLGGLAVIAVVRLLRSRMGSRRLLTGRAGT